jgi:hypothetical protein
VQDPSTEHARRLDAARGEVRRTLLRSLSAILAVLTSALLVSADMPPFSAASEGANIHASLRGSRTGHENPTTISAQHTSLSTFIPYLPTIAAYPAAGNKSVRSTLATSRTQGPTGRIFYVDRNHPQALDSNPGTEALPWKTIQKAAAVSVAGDTVLVKAGTYETSEGGFWSCPIINPANSGQPGSPITFKVYPGHMVIFDNKGNRNPTIGTCGRAPATNHIVIDGFTFTNGAHIRIQGPEPTQRIRGVIVQNNTVSGLWLSVNDNVDGIRVDNTSFTTVRNNRIYNIHNAAHSPNAAGIKLYNSDHAVVEHNEIFDVDAGIHDKQSGEFNVYRRNLIHEFVTVGILFQNGGSGNKVHGNQVYENIIHNGENGIGFWSASDGLITDTSVYNNTFADYTGGATHTPAHGGNSRFWNNILYRTAEITGYDFATYDDPPVSIALSDYNLFAMGPKILIGLYQTNRLLSSLKNWQSYSGRDRKSLAANPLFVNPGKRDFRLSPTSPALRAGRAGGVTTGAVVNIGAYTTGTEVIGPKKP